MNWRKMIEEGYASRPNPLRTQPVFAQPASSQVIDAAQAQVGFGFAADLIEFLLETNGVSEKSAVAGNLGVFLFGTAEIVEVTTRYRESDLPTNMAFSDMCFIGTPHVDGIDFALRKGESIVYAWYPIDSEFRPLAQSLPVFVQGWISGQIFY